MNSSTTQDGSELAIHQAMHALSRGFADASSSAETAMVAA